VADPEMQRLLRDMEDVLDRIRSLESLSTPGQAQMRVDLREVKKKIDEMDVHGTAVTQVRLKNIEDDVIDLKNMLSRQEEAKGADRRVMLGALLAAGSAIGMAIIGVVIQIITKGTP
jgi:hypothetical protein